MRISRYELDTLIKEEVNEILGFGKKESSKQYPADAMAYLLRRLFAIASEVGVEPDGSTRETIVGEIEKLLSGEGYELHEQLNLGGNVEFALTGGEAPKLLGLIKDIITKKPAAAALITRLFKRGAIDTDIKMGSLATAPPASAAVAAKDTATPADKAATTSTKPSTAQIDPPGSTVSPAPDPEDLIATDKVTAVARPGQEESPETLKKGDIVRVVDDPHLDPGDYEVFATNRGATGTDVVLTDREGQDPKVLAHGMKLVADQPENYQVNPEIEEPEEEAPLKVGDIVRVKENDISGIKPGDYEVADIYAGTRNDPQPWVLLTAEDGEGGYRDHLSLIVDNPDFFQVNPEDEEAEEEEDSKWDNALNKVQAGLDIAGAIGLFPHAMIISKPATLASLALNTSRGMYGWALFDLISLIPFVGEAMKAGKVGVKGVKAVKSARVAKFGAMRKLVAAGHAGKARKAAKAVKGAKAGMALEKGAEGIVELVPDDLLQKLINEKTDEGEPLVPWMIETLGNAPGFGDAAPKLLAAWQDVVDTSNSYSKLGKAVDDRFGPDVERPDEIPAAAVQEQKELDRIKVLAGVK